ncbi:MAG TPA: competence/damage-inducible protein A [bacterium]|nr:competence/damage-inducible protein A [bacterium]HPR86440.1 competence/damage-inducible protein A [bacterium]
MLCIEIISIGDELLIGQTINTNAAWIGQELLEVGQGVSRVTTVGDDLAQITAALAEAEARADYILVTGGLGPTNDDITRTAVCDYFGVGLIRDEALLDHIRALFERRHLPMARVNEDQALVPESAQLIHNDRGTAPGYRLMRAGKRFYFMPGVPYEMQAMMKGSILPELQAANTGEILLTHHIATIGIAESTLYERIGDIAAIETLARIAFLPSPFGVRIRLNAAGATTEAARQRLEEAAARVRRNIQPWIFAERNITLEAALGEELVARQERLAVAESCTGGLIANRLTNIAGSSRFFERGVVSYSNAAKIALLGVPEPLIARHGAVSAAVAEAMAVGIRRISSTEHGLGITGIAGPDGGSAAKPVGLVFVGYAGQSGTTVEEHHVISGDRLINKERFAALALNLLRKQLFHIQV